MSLAAVTVYQLNASLMNKSTIFFKNLTDPKHLCSIKNYNIQNDYFLNVSWIFMISCSQQPIIRNDNHKTHINYIIKSVVIKIFSMAYFYIVLILL